MVNKIYVNNQKLIHVYLMKRLYNDTRNTCASRGKNIYVCESQPLCLDLAGRKSIMFSHVFPPRNNPGEWEGECDSEVYPVSVWDGTDKSAAVGFTVQLSAIRVCLHWDVLPQRGFKVRLPGETSVYPPNANSSFHPVCCFFLVAECHQNLT